MPSVGIDWSRTTDSKIKYGKLKCFLEGERKFVFSDNLHQSVTPTVPQICSLYPLPRLRNKFRTYNDFYQYENRDRYQNHQKLISVQTICLYFTDRYPTQPLSLHLISAHLIAVKYAEIQWNEAMKWAEIKTGPPTITSFQLISLIFTLIHGDTRWN